MNPKPKLITIGRVLGLLTVLGTASVSAAFGQAQQPKFVAGEIVLYFQPGTAKADVDAVAAKVNPDSVTALTLQDCYKVVLKADKKTDADTLAAVASLKQDVHVRWVGPNKIYKILQSTTNPTVEPNDTRYKSGEMWGLKMIRMPEAWAITKGGLNANVAVIDTAMDPDHEDLKGQYLPQSFNADDGSSNLLATEQHGVHVSGTIIARTNNGLGVAGICWENIKCLGIRTNLSFTSLVTAWNFVADNAKKLNIKACNMSFGGGGDPNDTTTPEYVAIKKCVDAGVMMIAAAGNDNASNFNFLPCGYPFVFSVSALGPTGTPSSFTSFGKVEIAAPGGDQSRTQIDADGVLSTYQKGYAFLQGTSMASPHVTAVATLLMSVPGVDATRAATVLKATANASKKGTDPSNKYGSGIMDAYAALAKVSFAVSVVSPGGIDPSGRAGGGIVPPVETQKPLLRFEVRNFLCKDVTIKVDDTTYNETFIRQHIESGDCDVVGSWVVAFRQSFQNSTQAQHTIQVIGNRPAPQEPLIDTRIITLTAHTIPAGLSFASIPYFENATDSPAGRVRTPVELLGPDATLYRWINRPTTSGVAANYAVFGNGATDEGATFAPSDAVTTVAPNADVRPLGLGYFIIAKSPISVLTYGIDVPKQSVSVPLQEGWNMVGNPYSTPVAFNTVLIQTATNERISIATAVERKLIIPIIYRLTSGEYTFQVLPQGTFVPWEAHWLYVAPKDRNSLSFEKTLTLIFTPTGSSTRAATPQSILLTGTRAAKGTGDWKLQLVAKTKDLHDSYNFVGMTTQASAGASDVTRVPKPPLPTPYISLGIVRPDSSALLAQDIRPAGGTKEWDVLVHTDQQNSDVTLSWPDIHNLPRHYRMTLTDKVTGQTIDLRHQSSYQFNSGANAATRQFTLVARPTTVGGRALLTNILVNPSRADGRSIAPTYEINYTTTQEVNVEASILGMNGKLVAQVSPTRAATVGENRLVWNGRDSKGQTLTAGTYLLQIRALTPEGELTRQTRPFIITGR